MALDIKDGLGSAKTLKTSLSGSDHVPHHILDAGTAEIGKVAPALATTVVTGQETVTASAVQFNGGTSKTPKGKVLVKALATNTGIVYIGPSGVLTTTGFALNPGDSQEFDISDVNKLYHIGTLNDKLTWMCNT
jgi:hypothetical protein